MTETLTKEQVEEIRKLAKAFGAKYKEIAEKFGLDEGHIRYIARREVKKK